MTSMIDCDTLQQHREAYRRGEGPIDLVEAHLATCPSCFDRFLDDALATPLSAAPPWGFATRVVAHLPADAHRTGARVWIPAIAALIGVAAAAFVMIASGGSASTAMVTDASPLEAGIVAEAVVLFWLLTRRRGVLAD